MFYDKVRAYCTNNQISEYRFEKMCDLPKGLVRKWRRINPSYVSIAKICKATNTDPAVWMEEAGNESR